MHRPAEPLSLLRARFDLWSRHVAASRRPILLGPWTSEIGFEALYWLPFLAWWRERYHIDRSRLIALGRGGSAVWYDAAGTADLYDHVPVKDIRCHTWLRAKQTGSVKQVRPDALDRHVCGLVAASLGLERYHTLHPSWMYRLLAPYWSDARPIRYLHDHTRYARLPAPVLPPGMELPERFVAVRFYARPTFQPSEDIVLWAQTLVERMAQAQPVILLHSGGHYDDHADLIQPVPGKVFTLPPLQPSENVAVLSAVLGRASAFVGTYGGFAQLALRMGIPSVSAWTQWGGTALAHLALSQVLSTVSGVPFVTGTPPHLDGAGALLGRGKPAAVPVAPGVLP